MAAEFKTLTILTVYVGEDVYYKDKPIYKCIFEEARKAGIAGGTVFKCIEGYASQKRGMEKRFLINFTDPINLPVVVQLVDKRERLERLYPFLEKNLQHATMEAKQGILVNVSTSANIAIKIAIVRKDRWVAVAMFGESAVHHLTNHSRAGLGIMHI